MSTRAFVRASTTKMTAFLYYDAEGSGAAEAFAFAKISKNRAYDSYTIGLPRGGKWQIRFNSDWSGYSSDFGDHLGYDTVADPGTYDGLGFRGNIGIGPYSALILTQEI